MTARVLMIGNSHIRALRDALAEDPGRWDGLTVDTFGFRGAAMPGIEVSNGRLRAVGDFARQQFEGLNEGRTDCAITGYDALVVVGFDFKPLDAVALARAAVWPGLPSLAEVEDLATMRQTLISAPAARAALDGSLETCDAARLVRALRAEVDCSIFLIACPRLSQRAKWTDVPRFFGHGRAIRTGDAPVLDKLWDRSARDVCQRIGARFLPQHPETVFSHVLTRQDYMVDAEVTLPTAQGPRRVPDMTHANAAYGALMLDRLAVKMAAEPGVGAG